MSISEEMMAMIEEKMAKLKKGDLLRPGCAYDDYSARQQRGLQPIPLPMDYRSSAFGSVVFSVGTTTGKPKDFRNWFICLPPKQYYNI